MSRAKPRPLLSGQVVLDHFRLDVLLGRGGQGEVWQAFDVRLKRKVAIKFLLRELADDADYVARFEREMEIVAKFQHHNIARIHEAGRWDGRLCMVMELLKGKSLRQVLAENKPKPLTIKQALFIAIQVLEALREAHEEGIAHRDINPANVIVGRKGHTWVVDFGIAVRREVTRDPAREAGPPREGDANQMIGTPWFMSPEQVNGEPVDHRADLFAVGMLLYVMLSAQFPYPGVDSGATDTLILAAHALIEPEPLTGVVEAFPEELSAIVLRLLAKDPDARYPSAEAALDDLSVYLRSSIAPDDEIAKRLAVEARNAVGRAQWRTLTGGGGRAPGTGRSTMPLAPGFKPESPCAFVPENPWASERMAETPPAPSVPPPPEPAPGQPTPSSVVPSAPARSAPARSAPAQSATPARPAFVDAALIVPLPDGAGALPPASVRSGAGAPALAPPQRRAAGASPARSAATDGPTSSPWSRWVALPPAGLTSPLSRAEPVSTMRAWAPVRRPHPVALGGSRVRTQLAAAVATGALLAVLGVGAVLVWARSTRLAVAAPAPAASVGAQVPNAGPPAEVPSLAATPGPASGAAAPPAEVPSLPSAAAPPEPAADAAGAPAEVPSMPATGRPAETASPAPAVPAPSASAPPRRPRVPRKPAPVPAASIWAAPPKPASTSHRLFDTEG
jgi:serine/threonine-protein kinase